MMDDREHRSPDGQLRLLAISPEGDLTIGFDGFEWHTHGSILAELSGLDEEEAAERFIADIVDGRRVIELTRVDGKLTDAVVHEDSRSNEQVMADSLEGLRRYGKANETIEFRFWDGRLIEPAFVG